MPHLGHVIVLAIAERVAGILPGELVAGTLPGELVTGLLPGERVTDLPGDVIAMSSRSVNGRRDTY